MASNRGLTRAANARPSPGVETVLAIRRGVYAPPEIARPVVTIISPPAGGPIAGREPVVFEVTCTETIELQRFNIRTGGPGARWEVQYRDGEVSPGASVVRTAITDGYRFVVTPDSRWLGRGLDLEPTFGTATALAAMND